MNSTDTNQQDFPQGQPNNYYNNNGGNLVTPNSIPVLVLGILSIVMCWCYGLLSVVLAIIAIVLANAGEKEYRLNPNAYSLSSYKNLKAGKTCAVIGLCLAGVAVICIVIYIIIVGSLAFNFLNLGLTN
ncbi:MAG: CCC motif membrane protein [Bacteroidota bacterium]